MSTTPPDHPVALRRCGGCDVSAGQPHHLNCAYARGVDGETLVQTPDEPRVASCVTRTLLELIEAYAKADARSPLNPDAAELRAEIVTRLDRIRDYADEPSGRVVRQQLSGTS